jgi:hypothetical protein
VRRLSPDAKGLKARWGQRSEKECALSGVLYRDGGLLDVTRFKMDDNIAWTAGGGRSVTLPMTELKDRRGRRAVDAAGYVPGTCSPPHV